MAEAKKRTAKTKNDESKNLEQSLSPEKEVTAPTVESPQEEQTIINEKHETDSESVIAADSETTKSTAKAGKRSAKSIKQAEEKQAKEERKQTDAEQGDEAKKVIVPPTRSKLERRSKAYRQKAQVIEKDKRYSLEDAAGLIGKTNPVKFDATVELHVRLSVDPRQADQNVRDNVILPAGSGKTVRVAAFVDGDGAASAKEAGADLIGEADIIKELESGSFSFDVLVATPAQMPKLGKYARTLGPRGLMPNPKSGTVTTDIAKAIKEAKAGKVEYRVDSGGIIHIGVGKTSFKAAQLLENLQAVITSIQANKPASIKGTYVTGAHLTTTMGPSIRLAL